MPEERAGLPVIGFPTQAEWEAWLDAQPRTSPGVWVKLARKGVDVASIDRAEAIEGALCHGWIDGQVVGLDERFWLIRFTPRRPGGKWSLINRRAATALIEAGRMRPAGLAEVERARADGRWDAAYAPPSEVALPADFDEALRASLQAGSAFAALDAHNRFAFLHRIGEAKRPETRAKRIATFVAMLERGEVLHPKRAKRTKT